MSSSSPYPHHSLEEIVFDPTTITSPSNNEFCTDHEVERLPSHPSISTSITHVLTSHSNDDLEERGSQVSELGHGAKSEIDEDEDDSFFDHNSAEIRRVRWKVDRRLVPLLALLYLCSFLDRSNIGNAKVAGLDHDLNLKPGMFNTALSVFFIGYILGEIPANMLLKKYGPRLWIPLVLLTWGVTSMSMAAVANGAGLIAARFFLGLAESGYAPGPVYIISMWYRRCEQAIRISLFFSAATIAGAFGGLLAYGIAQLDGVRGLSAWQWIFILEGLPTIFSAGLAYRFLPDFPETTTFLTPAEKALTLERLKIDMGQKEPNTDFSWDEAWATFKDWKVYAFIVIGIVFAVPFASLGLFVPSITLGFGFNQVTTQIMTAPFYALACLCTISMGFSSDRHKERGYHAFLTMSVAALGYILLILTRHSSTALRYVSLTICTCAVYSFIPINLSWSSSNIGGHTKKGVAIAAITALSQVGGALGGQVYRADDAPLYTRGHAINAGLLIFDSFLVLGLKFLLRRENNRRNRLSPKEHAKEKKECDMTDSNPDFRFFE